MERKFTLGLHRVFVLWIFQDCLGSSKHCLLGFGPQPVSKWWKKLHIITVLCLEHFIKFKILKKKAFLPSNIPPNLLILFALTRKYVWREKKNILLIIYQTYLWNVTKRNLFDVYLFSKLGASLFNVVICLHS